MKGAEPWLLITLFLGVLLGLIKGVAVPGDILPEDNTGLFNNAEVEAIIIPDGDVEGYTLIMPPGSRAAFTFELGDFAAGSYKVTLAAKADPGLVSIGLIVGDVCNVNDILGAVLEEAQQLMEGDHVMDAGLLLPTGATAVSLCVYETSAAGVEIGSMMLMPEITPAIQLPIVGNLGKVGVLAKDYSNYIDVYGANIVEDNMLANIVGGERAMYTVQTPLSANHVNVYTVGISLKSGIAPGSEVPGNIVDLFKLRMVAGSPEMCDIIGDHASATVSIPNNAIFGKTDEELGEITFDGYIALPEGISPVTLCFDEVSNVLVEALIFTYTDLFEAEVLGAIPPLAPTGPYDMPGRIAASGFIEFHNEYDGDGPINPDGYLGNLALGESYYYELNSDELTSYAISYRISGDPVNHYPLSLRLLAENFFTSPCANKEISSFNALDLELFEPASFADWHQLDAVGTITLQPGKNLVTMCVDKASDILISEITLTALETLAPTPQPTETPEVLESPWVVPGIVEAESFDGVDLKYDPMGTGPIGGEDGNLVYWFGDGERYFYTVSSPVEQNYEVSFMMSAFDPYTNGGTAVSFYIENGLSNCMLDRNEWQTRPHVDDDNLFTAGSLVQIMSFAPIRLTAGTNSITLCIRHAPYAVMDSMEFIFTDEPVMEYRPGPSSHLWKDSLLYTLLLVYGIGMLLAICYCIYHRRSNMDKWSLRREVESNRPMPKVVNGGDIDFIEKEPYSYDDEEQSVGNVQPVAAPFAEPSNL